MTEYDKVNKIQELESEAFPLMLEYCSMYDSPEKGALRQRIKKIKEQIEELKK